MSATATPSPTNLKTTTNTEEIVNSPPGKNHHVTPEGDCPPPLAAITIKTTKSIDIDTKKEPDKENKIENGEANGESAVTGTGDEHVPSMAKKDVVLVSLDLNINGNAGAEEKVNNVDGHECNGASSREDDKLNKLDIGGDEPDQHSDSGVKEITRGDNNLGVDDDDNAMDMPEKEEDDLPPKDVVENDPNFAVICSFLDKFASQLDVQYSILHLKTMFEDFTQVRQDLIDLHVKLLRKRRKYINKDRWESALIKFCMEYSKTDSWELERFGYRNAKLSLRLRLFLRLLETQFDFNQKFKTEVNSNYEASSLRLESFGRDIMGYSYWYQSDLDLNFRLYKEEPDDDGSWSVVCRNLPELHELIDDLQSKSTSDLKIESVSNSDDDSSNIALLLNANKEIIKKEEDDEDDQEEGDEEEEDQDEEEDTKGFQQIDQAKLASPAEAMREDEPESEQVVEVKVEPDEDLEQNEQSEIVSDNDDVEVRRVCDTLIEQVEEEGEGEEDQDNEANATPTANAGNKKKRKRKRAGYTWGKKKAKTSAAKKTSEEKEDEHQPEETKQEQEKCKKAPARKRRTELDNLTENLAADLMEKRTSRRIQVLQEKKQKEVEAEMKRLEREAEEKKRKQEAAKVAKKAAYLAAINEKIHQAELEKKSRKQRKQKSKVVESEEEEPESDDEEEEEEEDTQANGKKRKRRRRGKGKRKRGNNPWEDSDDDEEENHHLEEDYEDYEVDEEVLKFDEKDDEDWFACEEIDPEDEPVVVRRARTVKKSKDEYDPNDVEPVVNDDKPCGRCGKYDNPQWILLCDSCDVGFHTACLRPPLFIIPTGDWFCPPCEHKKLTERIIQVYESLTEALELKAREAIKKKKRWKYGTQCDIAMDNILNEDDSGAFKEEDFYGGEPTSKHASKKSRSARAKKTVTDEIDDLLDEYDDEFSDENDHTERHMVKSKQTRRKSKRADYSESDSQDDDSDSDSSESESRDDIDILLDEGKPKTKKLKKVNIEDFSRSGLKIRAARRRKPISYLLKEYDDIMKSAIIDDQVEEGYEDDDPEVGEEEEEEAPGLPRSIGKDMANIMRAEMPDFSVNPFNQTSKPQTEAAESSGSQAKAELKAEDDNEDDGDEVRKKIKIKQSSGDAGKKKRSLCSLDLSTDEEGDNASDEDFRMGEDDDDEEEDELTEVEDDDNDNTEDDSDEEYCVSTSRRRSSRTSKRPARFGAFKRGRSKTKKKSRDKTPKRRDTDEEDDDEEETEMSEEEDETEMSDQSSDFEPSSRKKRQAKKFSYREDSSSSDENVHFGSRKKAARGKYEDDEEYSEEEEDDKKKEKRSKRAFIDDEDDDGKDEFDKSVAKTLDKRSKGGDLKTYSKTDNEKVTDKDKLKWSQTTSNKSAEDAQEEHKDVPTNSESVATPSSTTTTQPIETTVGVSIQQMSTATVSVASVPPPVSNPPLVPAGPPPGVHHYAPPPPPHHHPHPSQPPPPPQQQYAHAHYPSAYPLPPGPAGSPYANVPPPPPSHHHPAGPYGPPQGYSYAGLPPPPRGGQWPQPPHYAYPPPPPGAPHHAYGPPPPAYSYPPRGPPPPTGAGPPHGHPPPMHQYQHPPPVPLAGSPVRSGADGYTLTNLDGAPSRGAPPPSTSAPPPISSAPQLLNLDSVKKTAPVTVPAFSQAPPPYGPSGHVLAQPYYAGHHPPPPPPALYDASHSSPSSAFHVPYPPPPPGYHHPSTPPRPGFLRPPQQQATPPPPYVTYPPPPPQGYPSPNGGFMIQNLLQHPQQVNTVSRATKSAPVATKSTLPPPVLASGSLETTEAKSKKSKAPGSGQPKKPRSKKAEKSPAEETGNG